MKAYDVPTDCPALPKRLLPALVRLLRQAQVRAVAQHPLDSTQPRLPTLERLLSACAYCLQPPARRRAAGTRAGAAGSEQGTWGAFEGLRRQREKALETAEQRLAATQEKLQGLGRLGRRRQRADLRAEIARQRTAVDLAREQLASMPIEPPKPRLAPTPQPGREPRRPVLTRGRELDRDVGLEL